jgi:hypothetical protein
MAGRGALASLRWDGAGSASSASVPPRLHLNVSGTGAGAAFGCTPTLLLLLLVARTRAPAPPRLCPGKVRYGIAVCTLPWPLPGPSFSPAAAAAAPAAAPAAAATLQIAGLDVGWHQQLPLEREEGTGRMVLVRLLQPGTRGARVGACGQPESDAGVTAPGPTCWQPASDPGGGTMKWGSRAGGRRGHEKRRGRGWLQRDVLRWRQLAGRQAGRPAGRQAGALGGHTAASAYALVPAAVLAFRLDSCGSVSLRAARLQFAVMDVWTRWVLTRVAGGRDD